MHTHIYTFFICLSFSLLPLLLSRLFMSLVSSLLSSSFLPHTSFISNFIPHIYFTTLPEPQLIQTLHLPCELLHTNICVDYI